MSSIFYQFFTKSKEIRGRVKRNLAYTIKRVKIIYGGFENILIQMKN